MAHSHHDESDENSELKLLAEITQVEKLIAELKIQSEALDEKEQTLAASKEKSDAIFCEKIQLEIAMLAYENTLLICERELYALRNNRMSLFAIEPLSAKDLLAFVMDNDSIDDEKELSCDTVEKICSNLNDLINSDEKPIAIKPKL